MKRKLSVVAPWKYIGRRWYSYLVPRVITASERKPFKAYRWLCFNYINGKRDGSIET